MKNGKSIFIILWLGVLFTLAGSCFKGKYEGPPGSAAFDPHLKVTHSVTQLLEMPHDKPFQEDVVIQGIVVMDDRNGNYFKKIVIQDTTAGIELLLDESNLFNDYPVGRKLYIKCKNLILGDDSGNPQMGYAIDASGSLIGIPATLFDQFIIKASFPNIVIPDTVTMEQLANPSKAKRYWNTLVAIKDIQFSDSSKGKTYADISSLITSTNRTLEDCIGGTIDIRSSGYANFQPYHTPLGNGVLTAIYTHFKNPLSSYDVPQLYIRDTNDVSFYQQRCDLNANPVTKEYIPLVQLRNLLQGHQDSINILPGYLVSGIVISDIVGANTPSNTLELQDHESGISIRFASAVPFYLGDSLLIDISGSKLSWYSNLLQISNIPVSKATKIVGNRIIVPRSTTISEINDQYDYWESTLVQINNCDIVGNGTYGGNKTFNDGTGSFLLYTRLSSGFANITVPTTSKTFIGILSVFGTSRQLQLRNLNDVQ